MLKTGERRRVRVKLPGSLLGSVSLRIDVQVMNLSLDGAMIEHRETLSPGATYPLFLKLTDMGLCFQAQIVWSHVDTVRAGTNGEREIRFRSGLRFTNPSDEARAHLQQYLDSVSPADPYSGDGRAAFDPMAENAFR